MKKFIALAGVAALAACNPAEDVTEEDTVEVDPASEPGGALLTMADGSLVLGYAAADGTAYTGAVAGPEPATWEVEDGMVCIDPPDDERFCATFDAVGEDGTFTANRDDGPIGSGRVISKDYAAGEVPAYEASAMLIFNEEGQQGLAIWTEDGKSYLAPEITTASWRVVDGRRCFTSSEEGATESCGTAGEPGEDGSFTVTPDDGEPYTVTPLI